VRGAGQHGARGEVGAGRVRHGGERGAGSGQRGVCSVPLASSSSSACLHIGCM